MDSDAVGGSTVAIVAMGKRLRSFTPLRMTYLLMSMSSVRIAASDIEAGKKRWTGWGNPA
jgi:hypothetical protein